jgi:glycosyltransferase involved in cell wall biosynthesis
MNILQISTQSYPFKTGGLETVVFNLAQNLKNLGHNVTILSGSENPRENEIVEGVSCHFYPFIPKPYFVRWFTSMVNQYKIQRELTAKVDFDLIITHHPLSVIAAKDLIHKKPNVYVFCSPLHEEIKTIIKHTIGLVRKTYIYSYYYFSVIAQKLAIRSSAHIAAISDFMNKKVKKISKKANVVTIPCGIDSKKFIPPANKSAVREELGFPKTKKVIFTVRRMVPRMGIDMLIKAVENNIDDFKNCKFIIAGKGELLEKYRKLVEKRNLSKIIEFPGYLSDESLVKHFQAADLYVQPTISLEGFGLTILESMACGTPALITPVGASPEIIDSFDNRFIADNIKPRDFGKKLADTLKLVKKDTDLPEKCVDFARENYSWEKMAKEILKLVD